MYKMFAKKKGFLNGPKKEISIPMNYKSSLDWHSDDPMKHLEDIKFLLYQFIRCSTDGLFDSANPYQEKCSGCAYERNEIIDMIKHYGGLVKNEKR